MELEELKTKQMKAAELLKELERSLAIKALWPDAFTAGKCRSHFVGNLNNLKDFKFVIVRNDGDRKEFEFSKAPHMILEEFLMKLDGHSVPHAMLEWVNRHSLIEVSRKWRIDRTRCFG